MGPIHHLRGIYRPAAFKGRGVDLQVGGVRYIEMHHRLGPPHSRGGDLELEGGVNVSL